MTTNIESVVYLLRDIPLDTEYNHTIDFPNIVAQEQFFDSKIFENFEENEDYSYIRDNEVLKVFANIDDLMGANYLYYINNGKRFYCFITKKTYVSANCTAIEFKVDVLQSFMFDYTLGECFVEREHQDRFTKKENWLEPIYNLESENLERGKDFLKVNENFIGDNYPNDFDLPSILTNNALQLFWVSIVAKEPLGTLEQPSNNTTNIKGLPTNVYTYITPIMVDSNNNSVYSPVLKLKLFENEQSVQSINLADLESLTQDPKVISISVSRYAPFNYGATKTSGMVGDFNRTIYEIYPLGLMSADPQIKTTKYGEGYFYFVDNPQFAQTPIFKLPHDKTIPLGAISPDNERNIEFEPKLNTNDYSYYELEIGNQSMVINIEDLPANEFKIEYVNTYSVKNSQAIIPLNYKGEARNKPDMLSFDASTNEMPLRTDAWLNYLAQNKASMVSGFITSALQTAGGIAIAGMTGGFGLAVAGTQSLGFAGDIANRVAQINDIKNTPDEVNQTALDIILDYAVKDLYIIQNEYSIRPQFKDKIFNYFYHYGYKCNTFKTPNTKSRYYFNYIKTIGANIITNIDNDFKNEILNAYDKGVTFWHWRNNEFQGVNIYLKENAEISLLEEI